MKKSSAVSSYLGSSLSRLAAAILGLILFSSDSALAQVDTPLLWFAANTGHVGFSCGPCDPSNAYEGCGCETAAVCNAGLCEAAGRRDEQCLPVDERMTKTWCYQGLGCVDNAFCEPVGGRDQYCRSRATFYSQPIALAKALNPSGDFDPHRWPSDCGDGLACDSSGFCRVSGGPDQICNTDGGCNDASLGCVNDKCVLVGVTGASCSSDADCYVGYQCDAGKCAPGTTLDNPVGRLDCPYGSEFCDRCASNVQTAFRNFDETWDGRYSYDAREKEHLPPQNAPDGTYVTQFTWWDDHPDRSKAASLVPVVGEVLAYTNGIYETHVQGFQRASYLDESYEHTYFTTRSDQHNGFAGFLVEKMPVSGTGYSHGRGVEFYQMEGTDHASSLQIVGRYAAVAAECSDCSGNAFVGIYDIKPMRRGEPAQLVSKLDVGSDGSFVAMTQLRDRRYLLFVGGARSQTGSFFLSGRQVNTFDERIDDFTTWSLLDSFNSSELRVSAQQTRPDSPMTDPQGYWDDVMFQNVNFITECETGDLYLAGMGAKEDFRTKLFGAEVDQYYAVYRLVGWSVRRGVLVDSNADLWTRPSPKDCSLRGGGGVHTNANGQMTLLCSSKLTTSEGNLTFSVYNHF